MPKFPPWFLNIWLEEMLGWSSSITSCWGGALTGLRKAAVGEGGGGAEEEEEV